MSQMSTSVPRPTRPPVRILPFLAATAAFMSPAALLSGCAFTTAARAGFLRTCSIALARAAPCGSLKTSSACVSTVLIVSSESSVVSMTFAAAVLIVAVFAASDAFGAPAFITSSKGLARGVVLALFASEMTEPFTSGRKDFAVPT